ncbi:MAG: hypothetical protein ACXWQE_00200 [Bdellovibrionales bacterium]
MAEELVERELEFHSITGFAASFCILEYIAFGIIEPVNPVIDIRAVSVPALDLLRGLFPAEITDAGRNNYELLKSESEIEASFFGVDPVTRKKTPGTRNARFLFVCHA